MIQNYSQSQATHLNRTDMTTYYQPLFNYLSNQHGLHLLESDMCEIINIVNNMKKQEQIDALRFRIEAIESHLAEQHKGANFSKLNKPEAPECVANNGVSGEGHLKEHIDNFFNPKTDNAIKSFEAKIMQEFGEMKSGEAKQVNREDINAEMFKVMRNTYNVRNLKASIKPDFIPDWEDAPEDAVCVAMNKDGQWCWYDRVPRESLHLFGLEGAIARAGFATNAYLLPPDYWKSTLMMRPEANAVDWATAPEWATCKAMDKSGIWNWYSVKPYIEDGMNEWCLKSANDKYKLIPNHPPSDKDWTETLEMRPEAISDAPDYSHLLPEGYEFCPEQDAVKWVKVDDIGSEFKIGCVKDVFYGYVGTWLPIRPIQYKVTTHEITTAIPDPYMPDWSQAPEGAVAHAWDESGSGFWHIINIDNNRQWKFAYTLSHLTLPPDLDWKQSLRVKPSK
jgi:hypothetical protein